MKRTDNRRAAERSLFSFINDMYGKREILPYTGKGYGRKENIDNGFREEPDGAFLHAGMGGL